MVTLQDVQVRFDQWFRELWPICAKEDPWIFLCLSALVDYLSRLATGVQYDAKGKEETPGRDEYINFVKCYFPPAYATFGYQSGVGDLPEQMYHVLRCGIVHSFCLIPDPASRRKGGRDRSIVLMHSREANSRGCRHLDQYVGPKGNLDAALFVAEDFYEDVKTAAYALLDKAANDPVAETNILAWFAKYPPIRGDFSSLGEAPRGGREMRARDAWKWIAGAYVAIAVVLGIAKIVGGRPWGDIFALGQLLVDAVLLPAAVIGFLMAAEEFRQSQAAPHLDLFWSTDGGGRAKEVDLVLPAQSGVKPRYASPRSSTRGMQLRVGFWCVSLCPAVS